MINVVGVIENGRILFLIETSEHGNRILGVNSEKKNTAFDKEKLFLTFHSNVKDLQTAYSLLNQTIEEVEREKAKLNITEIYTFFSEEKTPFYIKDIADLLFVKPTLVQMAAITDFLLMHKEYFKGENLTFTPYTQKEVEEKLNHKKKAQDKKRENEENEKSYYATVLEILNEKRDVFTKEEQKQYEGRLKILKDFSIFGEESSYKAKALEQIRYISAHANIATDSNYGYTSFKILVSLGIFNSDENLLLTKYKLPLDFTDEIKQEVKKIPLVLDLKKAIQSRIDLTHLETVTIDGEDTKDFDDALSVEVLEQGYNVYVHITDVAFWVKSGSPIDEEAKLRTRSLYLPDLTLPMLPNEISEGIASLIEGENRCVLTTCFSMDLNLNIMDYKIFTSVIKVSENYSYPYVNTILENKEHPKYGLFSTLYKMSLKLQLKRIEKQGGIEFLFPNINARVVEDDIQIKIFNPKDPSMFLVKEWMIIANYACAHFADINNIPFLFLGQEEPNDEVKIETPYIETKEQLFGVLRFMKKSYFSTECKQHYALGLDAYSQTTSPIRRYIDLVLQRQIISFLSKKPYDYYNEDLDDIKYLMESQKVVFQTVENESNKYFLLKYLLIHFKNKPLEGIVIKDLGQKEYLVELCLTLSVVKVSAMGNIENLSSVLVELHTIIPRLGIALGFILEKK